MNRKPHHLVDFAARATRSYFPTFNAHAAMWRLEMLIVDASHLSKIRSQVRENGANFGNANSTYEIVDYYAVGFATCLEWHARSRLVDLLNFAPGLIEQSDVRTIDKIALAQMSAESVTLPYIVGAGTRVSSIADYLAIFERIFKGLSLDPKQAEKILRSLTTSTLSHSGDTETTSVCEQLEWLFENRNSLVHEIGVRAVAHFSLRDVWTPEEAFRFGNIALAAIKEIEKVLTRSAPAEFPNRLDDKGYPEDELSKLRLKIHRLEDEITKKLGGDEVSNSHWIAALQTTRAASISDEKFLDEAEFLRPVRHIDLTRAIRLNSARSRVDYLQAVLLRLDV